MNSATPPGHEQMRPLALSCTNHAVLARIGAGKEADIVDDLGERVTRLEDALVDFATLVTEGTIPRPSFLVGSAGEDAGKRLAIFIGAIQRERTQPRADTGVLWNTEGGRYGGTSR